MNERVARVLAAIDRANARDPRRTREGEPFELDQSVRLSRWVLHLRPEASEALILAARGQHLERWTSPRTDYPEGRAGYLRWREDLKGFHARRTGELMAEAGYGVLEIQRVTDLVTKSAYRAGDPEGIVLEDALCLVFLETQFPDLLAKTPEDKMAEILRKTWKKMSPAAQTAARLLDVFAAVENALNGTLG